jgi:hypothetical protein
MGRSPADTLSIEVTVLNEQDQPLEAAVVSMHLSNNNSIVKTELTDAKGHARLHKFQPGQYYFVISFTGYTTDTTRSMQMSPGNVQDLNIRLHTKSTNLQEVMVQGIKPFVQFEKNGKVVVNPDASPSNAGTNILELLEKMPGVTIDQNGNISLKSKSNVLVMLDGKPTYLSGTDLANLLSSMSSAQVDQVELITNPPARYDASGNAGIINIKTKKNKQRGFNGNLNLSYNQGSYPKTSNSFSLNLREGKVNTYFNYNSTYNKFYVDLYALRKYYDDAGTLNSISLQPLADIS